MEDKHRNTQEAESAMENKDDVIETDTRSPEMEPS